MSTPQTTKLDFVFGTVFYLVFMSVSIPCFIVFIQVQIAKKFLIGNEYLSCTAGDEALRKESQTPRRKLNKGSHGERRLYANHFCLEVRELLGKFSEKLRS